ncbi:unnamed protein product [Mytilus edulis]|uniref:Uncharacterized protein n=1 Tax=Mytilus edulis TaxID=6550 RepID=A0A8S3RP79_MYTED|nr:unnamed protein product [Mytilus edulis]
MLCNKTGIHELNQQDGSVKTIVSVNITSNAYVVVRGDKIYYTDSDNHSVTCCDFQGHTQWTFQNGEITWPLGVTVDTDGNVFVAGSISQNVVVISSDGTQQKQLLSSVDGIELPHGLIYDRDNNQEENLTSLQEEKERIENDIAQTRIKINNHLDKMQADLIQTLYAKVKKENGKIEQVLKSLEEKQCQINEYQNTFENIKKYATDVQLSLSMKLMETNIEKVEEFMRSLKEGESLCQVMLVMKDTFDTNAIAVSMPYIGKIGIDYSPSQVSIIKRRKCKRRRRRPNQPLKSIANISP